MRLKYQLPIPHLPTRCPCAKKFDTQHEMSYKKRGFVTLLNNMLRDITGALLEEDCHDVAIETILQPVTDTTMVPD